MTDPTNPAAFPHVTQSKRSGSDTIYTHVAEGMTLRDYFAGQFLPAATGTAPEWQLRAWFGERTGLTREEIAARQSYAMADAMLAERARS